VAAVGTLGIAPRHRALADFGSRDAVCAALAEPEGPLVAWLLASPLHDMKHLHRPSHDAAFGSALGWGASRRGIHMPSWAPSVKQAACGI
jgi:hypothetical protein